MRMSELSSKDMIDLMNGGRLGSLGDTDLVIDAESGAIESIVVPARGRMRQKKTAPIEIPWRAIRRVGPHVMIVDTADIPKISSPGQN